jgi:predicted Zn finger-like uncharacterized protein
VLETIVMAVLTECPQCQRRWTVEENSIGHEVKCPSCGQASTAQSVRPPGLRKPRTVLTMTLATLALAVFGIFGPFAWWLGHTDLKRMQRGETDPAGMKTAKLGVTLGKIGTVKFAIEIFLIVTIVGIILAIALYTADATS